MCSDFSPDGSNNEAGVGRLRISVLGWGSIVWDRRDLAIAANFEPTGPRLPVEFCRVSRDGRLTLVIDEALGVPCITYSAVSAFDNLVGAIENLRDRENMTNVRGVGFTIPSCDKQSVRAAERHAQTVKTISAWTNAKGFDAAIWTALESNFVKKANAPFSVEAVIRYLEKRDAKTFDATLTYVRRAPPEVQTPVRVAINTCWPETSDFQ